MRNKDEIKQWTVQSDNPTEQDRRFKGAVLEILLDIRDILAAQNEIVKTQEQRRPTSNVTIPNILGDATA